MKAAENLSPLLEFSVQDCELSRVNPFVTSTSRFKDREWTNPEEMNLVASKELRVIFSNITESCDTWLVNEYVSIDLALRQILYYMRDKRAWAWATVYNYAINLRMLIQWMNENDKHAFRDLSLSDVRRFYASIRAAPNQTTALVRFAVIFKSLLEFGQAGLVCDYQSFDPFPGQSPIELASQKPSVPRVLTPPLSEDSRTKLYQSSYEFLRDVGPLIIAAAENKTLHTECQYGELGQRLSKFGSCKTTLYTDAIHFLIWAAFIQLSVVSGARNGEILKLLRGCLVRRMVKGVECYWVRGQPSKNRKQISKLSEWQISEHTLLALSTLEKLSSALNIELPGGRIFFRLEQSWIAGQRIKVLRATTMWAMEGMRRFAKAFSGIVEAASLTPRQLRVGLAEALSQQPYGIILANRALGHSTLGMTVAYINTARNRHRIVEAVRAISTS